MGLKPDLQGGTGFNLLRVQFWTPVQRKRLKGSESGPPCQSKVPPWRVQFWPLHCANSVYYMVLSPRKPRFVLKLHLTFCEWKLEA